MVSEITKEQKQGRNSTIKMIAVVVIAIVIITGLFMVLENSFIKLKPTDYKVTVTEITLDDVTIDKNKKLATYKDPDMKDISTDNASILVNGNDVPEGTVYVFGGKEYNYLMESGHAYKITVSSDKCFDTLLMSEVEDPKAISISVRQSVRNRLDGHKDGNLMSNAWFTEIDTIYDQSIYEKGDKDAAVVWRK